MKENKSYSWGFHLDELRKLRNFNTDDYIEMKTKAINNFFTKNSLDSAVIGISGGVDSAVVLMLLLEAKKKPGSPLKQILPLIVPIQRSFLLMSGS